MVCNENCNGPEDHSMYRKQITRPLPKSARIISPKRAEILKRDGSLKKVERVGADRFKEESENWYGRIQMADGTVKEIPLCPDEKEAREMLEDRRAEQRKVKKGLELAQPGNFQLLPEAESWVSRMRDDTEKSRALRMLNLTGFKTAADLRKPDASVRIEKALDSLRTPRSPISLPKGDKFSTAQLRAILCVSQNGVLKLIKSRGIEGFTEGVNRFYTRAEAANLVAHRNKGASFRTINGHLNAFRGFLNHLKRQRRLIELPIFPSYLDVTDDPRLIRRALSLADLRKLVESTRKSGVTISGLSAETRATAYAFAFHTLLRHRAVRELRVADLHFSGESAQIRVRASTDKNKKARTIPLRDSPTVQALARLARSTPEATPIFPLPPVTAEIMRGDLKRAGIPYKTEEGIVDFHALRHSGTAHLIRAGVDALIVARMGGWSSTRMIFQRYGHIGAETISEALERAGL